MVELPAPLVAAEVDLTDFPFMPLYIEQLRKSKSWLVCKRRPELAFYMLNLWLRAWHERPAASIEDDDDVLADAAGCAPDKWPSVRADALRGWVRCTDGRLYHPVVAIHANQKWTDKLIFRWSKECDRIRKENKNRKDKGLQPLGFPPRPDEPMLAFPTDDSRNSNGKGEVSGGIPAENPLKGEGEGEGESKGEGSYDPVTNTKTVTTTSRPRAKKRAANKGTQLPDGWSPSEELRQWTIDYIRERKSGVSAGHELEVFRDHWKKTGKPMKDWDATWRNWIREAIRREGKPNGTQPRGQTNRRGQAGHKAAFGAALSGLGREGPAGGGDRREDAARDVGSAVVSNPPRTTRRSEEGG